MSPFIAKLIISSLISSTHYSNTTINAITIIPITITITDTTTNTNINTNITAIIADINTIFYYSLQCIY